MDAISFVLGIKSSHLRSTQLKDLIYRGRILKTSKINADGTATEGGENGESNGVANGAEPEQPAPDPEDDEGTRSSQRHDPKTAWVMAVYLDDADEEQKWKRTITSSGASEYRINGRVVSQKDYNEALETENILIKARNFLVFQGDVEQIASQAPRDLTRLVEQISGSLEYKADFERLKGEMEAAEKEAKFKYEQKRSINTEVKQYQEQKEEADNYNRKVEERDEAIIKHTLWKLYHLQRNIDEANAEIQRHQEEVMEHQRRVQQFENQLEEARRAQARAAQEVAKKEKAIKRKDKEVEEKQISLDPIEIKILNLQKKVQGYQDRVNAVKKERNSQQETVEKLKKELATVQKAQKKAEDDARELAQQEGRELTEIDLREYEQLRVQVTTRTSAAQTGIDNLARQIKTTEEIVNSLKTKVDVLENGLRRLEEEETALREQKQGRTAEVKDLKEKVDAKKKELNVKLSEKSRVENKRQEHNEKLQDLYMKLAEAEGGRRRSEKEQRDRENIRSLKSTFGDDRVYGRISDLCKPMEKRFEFAVETALGHHLDSVVVDTEKTATECIENLNALKRGVITVIPLDTAQIKPIDPNLKGAHPKTRLLIDAISYDNKFERAMSFACGNTLVCDDLGVARKVVYSRGVRVKAVTLDGSIIHKGGNMTGGRGPEDRGAKRRWEGEDVDAIQKLADKLRDDLRQLPSLHALREDEEKLKSELNRLELQRQFAEEQLKGLNRNIESKKKELENAKAELKENRPILKQQQQRLEALRDEITEHQQTIAEVEDEVFGAFCQRLGYDNIRTYEAQQGSMQQELNETRRQYETHRTRLESQLKFETERLQRTKERIKKLDESSKKDKDDLAALEADKEKLENEIDDMKAELAAHKEELEELKSAEAEKKEKVNQERAEFQKRSRKLEAAKSAINHIEQDKRKHAANRYTLLRQCKIDKTKIPLQEGSEPLDALPLDDILQEDPDAMDVDDDVDVTTLPARGTRDYGIEIDFDNLDEELQEVCCNKASPRGRAGVLTLLQDNTDKCEEKLLETIQSINNELEKMSPNSRAEERLENVKRRLASADEDHKTASRSLQRSKREFERVKEQRLELFNKAFNHISEQIVGVYKELTRSTSFPMGGTAHLTVENDDEPYLEGLRYHAMPPLKRFRDMEHLSGGEKTIAALALLFAVHSFQPSPFFVLDEVDAALDNVNVSRVANYVKEHARPGMQFIVISLKTGLFQESESLVGVMRDQGDNTSKVITLDVSIYNFPYAQPGR